MPGNSVNGALPALVFAIGELQARIRPLGIAWQVADYGGLRTQSDTVKILAFRDADWNAAVKRDPSLVQRTTKEQWRKISPWGRSMHNYGAAFDVEIVSSPPGMSRLAALNIVLDAGVDLGLVSGRSFGDPPHLELAFPGASPGASALAAAKAEWRSLNGTAFFRR